YLAAAQPAKNYPHPNNLLLPPLTLILILIFQPFTTPFLKSIPILIPLIIPTLLPPIFPLLDLKQVRQPHSLPIPIPFPFSPFPFHLPPTLLFFILPMLSLIQSTAVYHPLTHI
ncbi:solute carrier family 23 protein, partial [Staphylococcus warneri]|uniref:solute carrier family 23 protein n=1 Tax=Staphylococcus warneri TaxID=1292 RepID=UPI0037044CA0